MDNKELSSKWLELAKEDFKMAQLALAHGIYLQAMFHCQQCVEKSIKGLIVLINNVDPPYSHDLVRLFREIQSEIKNLNQLEKKLTELNPYYIATRYPSYKINISKGLTKEKVLEMIATSEEVLKWLEQQKA